MAILLYPARGVPAKRWAWSGVGVGMLAVAMAGWLLLSCVAASGSDGVPGLIFIETRVGVGAYLNLLTAVAVAAGAALRATGVLRCSS